MIPNLSKDMIDVMQVLRKALNVEFNIALKLSQPDIVDEIQLWAGKSIHAENKQLCAQLEALMGISAIMPEANENSSDQVVTKTHKRVYRGQVINETIAEHQQGVQTSAKTKGMYRGQVVS